MAVIAAFWTGAAGISPIGDGRGGDSVDTVIPVPSGQSVVFLDVVTSAAGAAGLTYRFRFVADWITAAADFEAVATDMAYLCDAYAMPRISNIGPQPAQIVISLSDKPIDFGLSDSDVVQYFEAYTPQDGACVWEFY